MPGDHVSSWSMRKRSMLFSALLATSMLAAPALARADEFQGLGIFPGGTFSEAYSISSNGLVVVGVADAAGGDQPAFRWTASSGLISLGFLAGGNSSIAYAASSDGSVVVGGSTGTGFNYQAFRWTAGTGMVGLGFLPGGNDTSYATAVSGDGAVVVGAATLPAGTAAFRWTAGTGMVSLGYLPGGDNSTANAVSADGSVIGGQGNRGGGTQEAFRWTAGGGMVGLGVLAGGLNSRVTAMSADGNVMVGSGDSTAVPSGEAMRWTASTGMVGLGVLTGGTFSRAAAISADGSTIVGSGSSATAPTSEAFRWKAATGMQSISNLLITNGVPLAGWTLDSANGISGDGSVVVGTGTHNGAWEGWLARFSAQFGNGFITPGVVAQSFAGQSAMGHTGNAALGYGLGTFVQQATQAGGSRGNRNTPYSVFASGGYDSDPAASGTLGMTMDFPDDMIGGAAVSANYVKTDMVYDGNAKMSGGTLGAFLARVPNAGLQWLVGANVMTLKGDVTRGYLNGSGLASSTGNTTASGYGFIGRIGWTFDKVWPATQMTPFISYTYTSIHFNGYTEGNGPFPAQFNGFTDNAQTTRVGVDARYTLAPGKWLWGTLAWAHRLDGGKSSDITGNLIGLFTLTAQGNSVAQDWAEVTAGVRLPAWKNGALNASLTASIPTAYATTYAVRAGVTQAF